MTSAVPDIEEPRRKASQSMQEVTTRLASVNNEHLYGFRTHEFLPFSLHAAGHQRLNIFSALHNLPVRIPEQIERSLLTYLSRPPPPEPFSCLAFVQCIMGLEGGLLDALDRESWKWGYADEEALIPNESIIMLFPEDPNLPIRHIALKISEDLYLSKAGPHVGALLLADLATMKKLWQASRVLMVRKA